MRGAIAIAAALVCAACTDPQAAADAAEAYGLTNVTTTGYEPFGCSDRDTSRTGFRATNARGQVVEGVVCSDIGPFGKASTVRIFRVVSHGTAVPMAR
jgi:ABC-type amino acid transport substrate-binding protein